MTIDCEKIKGFFLFSKESHKAAVLFLFFVGITMHFKKMKKKKELPQRFKIKKWQPPHLFIPKTHDQERF